MGSWVYFLAGAAIGAVAALSARELLGVLWRPHPPPPHPAPFDPAVPTHPSGAVPPYSLPRIDALPAAAPLTPHPGPYAPASPKTAVTREQVALSQRILVHLFRLGRIGPDEVGLPTATQRGIGEALHAEQSAVSKALSRLVAAEVVVVRRRHVRGGDRRVNVYTLTRRGELVVHELRAQAARMAAITASPGRPPGSTARAAVPVHPELLPTTPR
jgi:DNA-binding MarR family transcriptional regulator